MCPVTSNPQALRPRHSHVHGAFKHNTTQTSSLTERDRMNMNDTQPLMEAWKDGDAIYWERIADAGRNRASSLDRLSISPISWWRVCVCSWIRESGVQGLETEMWESSALTGVDRISGGAWMERPSTVQNHVCVQTEPCLCSDRAMSVFRAWVQRKKTTKLSVSARSMQ